jgi:Skp family chaperone for outer membrane proteins
LRNRLFILILALAATGCSGAPKTPTLVDRHKTAEQIQKEKELQKRMEQEWKKVNEGNDALSNKKSGQTGKFQPKQMPDQKKGGSSDEKKTNLP